MDICKLTLSTILMLFLVLSISGCGESSQLEDQQVKNDTEPLDIDTFETTDASVACVYERTGSDLPVFAMSEDETIIPLYYTVNIGCRLTEEEGYILPEPVRRSFFEENSVLKHVSRCLSDTRGWSRSSDILDGVGGAIKPNKQIHNDTARDLSFCGFNNSESIAKNLDEFEGSSKR